MTTDLGGLGRRANDAGPSPTRPQLWECTERHCTAAARTVDGAIPMHQCTQLGGALVPLVKVGTRGQQRAIEREDWVRDELVQPVHHRGKLIMRVDTETPDSLSTTVYLPTAQVRTPDDVRDARHEAPREAPPDEAQEGSADG